MIELRNAYYSYKGSRALEAVSLIIKEGEHVALIGPNASGKTTLAMLMNALLIPCEGDCFVNGVNTKDEPMFARKAVGMVFQDPESQAVASLVRDDVAFGPINLGLPAEEVDARVRVSLGAVGMGSFAGREVSCLSGGQKQLLAIAGALAMRPPYVVMDEPTSLLDGRGVKLVDEAVSRLKNAGIGVIVITHDMSEALRADRIIALKDGRVIADVPPNVFFSSEILMGEIGAEPPYGFELLRAPGSGALAEEASIIWR